MAQLEHARVKEAERRKQKWVRITDAREWGEPHFLSCSLEFLRWVALLTLSSLSLLTLTEYILHTRLSYNPLMCVLTDSCQKPSKDGIIISPLLQRRLRHLRFE